MIDDELLSRYLDGDLPGEEAERVQAALATDAALAARAEQFREADQRLRAHAGSIDERPLPPALANLLAPDAAPDSIVVPLRSQPAAPPPRAAGLRPLLALAASICLAAVVLLVYSSHYDGRAPAGERGLAIGPLPQGSALARALEHTPSAKQVALAGDTAGSFRALLTFRDPDGRFCREFEQAASAMASRGIACRARSSAGADAPWEVVLVGPSAPSAAADTAFRPAAGEDAGSYSRQVDAMIAEGPFGAAQEAATMASGWQAGQDDH